MGQGPSVSTLGRPYEENQTFGARTCLGGMRHLGKLGRGPGGGNLLYGKDSVLLAVLDMTGEHSGGFPTLS